MAELRNKIVEKINNLLQKHNFTDSNKISKEIEKGIYNSSISKANEKQLLKK